MRTEPQPRHEDSPRPPNNRAAFAPNPTPTRPATLHPVRCNNPLCPPYIKSGRAKLLGEAAPGSHLRLRCPACKQFHEYQL